MNIISDLIRNKENIKTALQSGKFRGTEIEDIFKFSLPTDDPEYSSWEWARKKIGKKYGIIQDSDEVVPESIQLKYIELVEFCLI